MFKMVHLPNLLLLLGSCYYCSVGAIEFIGFGAEFDDQELTPDSVLSSADLTFDRPIIFFGEEFTSVSVSYELCKFSTLGAIILSSSHSILIQLATPNAVTAY